MKRAFPDGDGYVGVEMEPFDFWKSSLPRVLIVVSAGFCVFFAILSCVRA